MARTSSTMVPLGTPMPEFRLLSTDGEIVGHDDFDSAPGLLVMFICNHCPYVVHIREVLAKRTREWMDRGLAVVAISSNDISRYPADSPQKMKEEKARARYRFPYLFDASQQIGLSFRAACTPDFFLYDTDRTLAYRGRFDISRPGSDTPVTGEDLSAAVDALLAGEEITVDQVPSVGCNIKWTPKHVDKDGRPKYPPLPT